MFHNGKNEILKTLEILRILHNIYIGYLIFTHADNV